MRGRLIHWPGVLRFLVYVAIAIALVVAATFLPRHAQPPVAATRLAAPSKPVSPLMRELARCEDIGEKAENDSACLKAWSENRHQFFDGASGLGATPNGQRDSDRRSWS
jgi:conjugative transfer region protein TrbK